jgi:rare lipoprotein A
LKFIGNSLKSSLFLSLLLSVFLFTGCSQKSSSVDYNKFYKDTKNSKINNSLEMHKYTMRPYSVFGIKYYPFIANIGDDFEGTASWYGPDFHSKKTSNGEIYDMYDMTAAHKTLPMNTVVRVDNLENGKSIIVRINDRGPFVRGRIIDLSNKAANEIDMVRKGTAKVKITVLGYNGEIENKDAPYAQLPKNDPTLIGKKENVVALEPLAIKEDSIISTKTPVATAVNNKVGKPIVNTNSNKNVAKSTSNTNSNSNNKALPIGKYSIQVGAFGLENGAVKTQNEYQRKFANNKVDVKKVFSNGKVLYKVLIGGFNNADAAKRFKDSNALGNVLIISN